MRSERRQEKKAHGGRSNYSAEYSEKKGYLCFIEKEAIEKEPDGPMNKGHWT